ncbi:hypothetical protein [Streptomyces sp. YIM 121038]|uniref:hypothetical protein n=1 Tax=Streptomyces sp. YIM 121038 TaxID=2136401 RepID=UPI001110EE62|nr:hypothetical protein [Streptomyces sp. YIM 121038]
MGRRKRRGRWGAAAALAVATLTAAAPASAQEPPPGPALSTVEPSAPSGPRPDGRMAETGAGVLPWAAAAGAAALGVGAVAFATTRRRSE